jgi:ketopantoate reductase
MCGILSVLWESFRMKNPVVVVGIGEMGSVFARGFLRLGHPVYPVVRDTKMGELAKQLAEPELVVIAVAEKDIQTVLQEIPGCWRDRLVLLQNELLPDDWSRHRLEPSVISVWFEKKKGMDSKVIIPSPLFGKHAQLVADALNSIDIETNVLGSAEDLLFQLVLKNVYILTTNIAGLQTGGTVGELWSKHRQLATEVANEIIQLQEKLAGQALNKERLLEGMVQAFNGDPEHGCMGRSAAARLERVLKQADEHGLDLPGLKRIASKG